MNLKVLIMINKMIAKTLKPIIQMIHLFYSKDDQNPKTNAKLLFEKKKTPPKVVQLKAYLDQKEPNQQSSNNNIDDVILTHFWIFKIKLDHQLFHI